MAVHSLLMYQRGIQNWSVVKVSVVNLLIVRGLKQKNEENQIFVTSRKPRSAEHFPESLWLFFIFHTTLISYPSTVIITVFSRVEGVRG